MYCYGCDNPLEVMGEDIRLERTVKCSRCAADVKLNDINGNFKKLYLEAKSFDGMSAV